MTESTGTTQVVATSAARDTLAVRHGVEEEVVGLVASVDVTLLLLIVGYAFRMDATVMNSTGRDGREHWCRSWRCCGFRTQFEKGLQM
jgi:hypothetical protein